METLNLELRSEVKSGRTQVGDIVAYYEQHIVADTREIDFIRVVYFKSNTVMVLLADSTETEEIREESMNATIEYSANTFRCQILNQPKTKQLLEIFWQIFNQLKLVE